MKTSTMTSSMKSSALKPSQNHPMQTRFGKVIRHLCFTLSVVDLLLFIYLVGVK